MRREVPRKNFARLALPEISLSSIVFHYLVRIIRFLGDPIILGTVSFPSGQKISCTNTAREEKIASRNQIEIPS